MVPSYGEHGFDTKPGHWSPPAIVDEATRLAARAALAGHDALLETKATRRQATEWALSLMTLTGGRQVSADDAKAKALAFAEMLIDYPAALLTRASLQEAAGAFKFFPAYAELAEFLDRSLRRLQREQKRLLVLAAIPRPKTQDVVRSAIKAMPGFDAALKDNA